MSNIHVLDFSVANLIAAGEVVDRPASAVKELLENAVDAGATAVTVEIKNGGITFMRVSDNGCGMEKDDLPIAIRRHATSKIRTAADLDGILTLGFRGEALAAIASVSHLRIMSRQKDAETGALLEACGGEVTDLREVGCAQGTTIIVEELFACVPARRKFLKKDQTEAMAVSAVVEKIALSRPDVSIRFLSDNNLRFSTSGDGKLSSAVYAVLGKDFARKLLEVNDLTDGISVSGFIGRPDNVRGNRNYETFFINGRYIKSGTASAALEQAFRSFAPTEKFPCCVLNIKIHPSLVDVNVHPTKLEVKFSNEKIVFDAVYCAVRNALTAHMTTPEMQVSQDSALFQRGQDLRAAFVPIRDRADRVEAGITPTADPGVMQPSAPQSVPPKPVQQKWDFVELPGGEIDAQISLPKLRHAPQAEPHKPIDANQNRVAASPPAAPSPAADRPSAPPAQSADVTPQPTAAATPHPAAPDLGLGDMTSMLLNSVRPYEEIKPKDDDKRGSEKPYRILGVAFHSYIILEAQDRVYIVDKHAAHERIIFEEMKKNRACAVPATQILLVPYRIELTPEESAAVTDFRDDIVSTGFTFHMEDDGKTVSLDSVPFGLEDQAPSELFVSMAGNLAAGTGSVKVAREEAFEEALYQASCKAAVKAGREDAPEHMDWICAKLLELPDIRFCPHGRPVAFELSRKEIEKQFKRT